MNTETKVTTGATATTHDMIELPPLRIPDLEDELTAVLCAAIRWGGSVISSEEYVAAKQRFRAAVNAVIEADRKTYNSIGEGTIQQLHDILLYLQNETMKLEAAYGSNFKKEATEKARAATEKMKEAVYAIKNIDRKRRGSIVNNASASSEPVAWLYEDELPDNYPYEAMFPYSKVDGVRMFPVYTPQPLSESDIPDEPDSAKCAECGAEMIHVRPGKWQHPDCSQSSWAAEPVKVNAIFETRDGVVTGTTDVKVKRVEWQDDGSLTVVIDYWPQPA